MLEGASKVAQSPSIELPFFLPLEKLLDILFNVWPNLDFWSESESGGHMAAMQTQHIKFYLFRFGGKVVPKGK